MYVLFFLETINSISNVPGLYSHWFWLNENTLMYCISQIGGIHQICVTKIDGSHLE